jgi:hypothetical protein
VKLLFGPAGASGFPRWVYGLHGDPARADISPGDYILHGQEGTIVRSRQYFQEHYRQVEE